MRASLAAGLALVPCLALAQPRAFCVDVVSDRLAPAPAMTVNLTVMDPGAIEEVLFHDAFTSRLFSLLPLPGVRTETATHRMAYEVLHHFPPHELYASATLCPVSTPFDCRSAHFYFSERPVAERLAEIIHAQVVAGLDTGPACRPGEG